MEYVVPIDDLVSQRRAYVKRDEQQQGDDQTPVHPFGHRLDLPAANERQILERQQRPGHETQQGQLLLARRGRYYGPAGQRQAEQAGVEEPLIRPS